MEDAESKVYMEQWTYHHTYSGTPQGSGVSPILANIYLSELDVYLENYQKQFKAGTSKRKASKEYSKRILDRGKWQGKKVWEYHYTDKKKQDKMLVIDGNSGKILKKKDVFVTY